MPYRHSRNLVLVGFMGSGKSTTGRQVAIDLGMPFMDTDRMIEEREGKTIAKIFEERGEGFFRGLESEIVQEVSLRRGTVIATGGGVVLRPENLKVLGRTGVLIHLHVDLVTALARTQGHGHRPLLNHKDREARLEALMRERQARYDAIPKCVETSGRTQQEVVRAVIRIYRAHESEPIREI